MSYEPKLLLKANLYEHGVWKSLSALHLYDECRMFHVSKIFFSHWSISYFLRPSVPLDPQGPSSSIGQIEAIPNFPFGALGDGLGYPPPEARRLLCFIIATILI
jgi:hypothetical protein